MKTFTRHGIACATALFAAITASAQTYSVTRLDSDLSNTATFTDPNLIIPWGLAASGTDPWWVSDNGNGLSTLYDGQGNIQTLVVSIPPSATGGATGTPTGIVANSTTDFGGAFFLFDSEDGTIQTWAGAPSASIAVDNGPAAVYKGLAMAQMNGANVLYAANFRTAHVDAYDTSFDRIDLAPEAFLDPAIPAGYAPFNVQPIGGNLFVTFAKQDSSKHDEVDGPGFGYVDEFNSAGKLLMRLQHGTYMNAPWGIALAGSNFGMFSGNLLVGNFGSGTIVAFNPATGKVVGNLMNASNRPIIIPGLWALAFGQGGANGPTNQLYYTAGFKREAHGIFGFVAAQ